MTTSIAEFYLMELNDWQNSIDFRLKEIDEFEEWLTNIIRLNTIPHLSATVEHHLNLLNLFKQNWLYLQKHIHHREEGLYTEQIPINNALITENLKVQQNELRNKMRSLEKEYVDVKYNCDDFLASTVIQQGRQKKDGTT